MTPDKTPTPKELEALARKHGATSYRNPPMRRPVARARLGGEI